MFTKFATSAALVCVLLAPSTSAQSDMREQTLRSAAIDNGLVPLDSIYIPVDEEVSDIGKKLFESELLSLNSDTSCSTCHIDRFGSADGLPNAIGTGGRGEGRERLMGGGDVVPRNTLPLWGRGSKGFDTFFWDGKVEKTPQGIVSQFGEHAPSSDPLVVSVHLPFVEVREMVERDDEVEKDYLHEDQPAAEIIFDILTERVKNDAVLGAELSNATNKPVDDLSFGDIASAVAGFIRDNFRVKQTKFHDFVFADGELSNNELAGGLIFYGKGQCTSCHNGPLFSDLDFHVIPFRQAGFGKNGFGVDYGRYNATRRTDDLYRFRTPPLINVTKTAPYSHSGQYATLEELIVAHTDPLSGIVGNELTVQQRRELATRIGLWTAHMSPPEPLTGDEIDHLVAFLATLSTSE